MHFNETFLDTPGHGGGTEAQPLYNYQGFISPIITRQSVLHGAMHNKTTKDGRCDMNTQAFSVPLSISRFDPRNYCCQLFYDLKNQLGHPKSPTRAYVFMA